MRFGMDFDSRRSAALGTQAAVATSTPAAAQAGYDILKRGGNAVDAAIAMAACLVITEPTSNGLGSDLFAIVWDGKKLHGLNASGRAPSRLTADMLRGKGLDAMPMGGWEPVTVPGMVDGWAQLSGKFGSLPLEEVLEPAAVMAEKGFPVSQVVSYYWGFAEKRMGGLKDFAEVFLPGGKAPKPGEIFRNEAMARSLRSIGKTNGKCFYEGELAEAIVEASDKTGGYFTKGDLLDHKGEWVEPISVNYRGYEVCEIPPNGQGIAALMALNVIEGLGMGELSWDDPARINAIADAMRMSFSDVHELVADPDFFDVPVVRMLDKDYAAKRRGLMLPGRAMEDVRSGLPMDGGTVYLCAADKDGMMVSLIQSNYFGFGSGIVLPKHGISLQNRGAGFSLKKGHPNELMPGKRPFHTIIPGFLMREGLPVGPFGVMGGDMQAQGHVQLVSSVVDLSLDPQSGIDMPRFRVSGGKRLHLEKGLSGMAEALTAMGYEVSVEGSSAMFGGGQMIIRDHEKGIYVAGTESRKDGLAIAF